MSEQHLVAQAQQPRALPSVVETCRPRADVLEDGRDDCNFGAELNRLVAGDSRYGAYVAADPGRAARRGAVRVYRDPLRPSVRWVCGAFRLVVSPLVSTSRIRC